MGKSIFDDDVLLEWHLLEERPTKQGYETMVKHYPKEAQRLQRYGADWAGYCWLEDVLPPPPPLSPEEEKAIVDKAMKRFYAKLKELGRA